MTGPDGDVTGNYTQIMAERGWSFDDLADDFARQAQGRALDGGASMRSLERWARGQATAARLRAAEDTTRPPIDPQAAPPQRTTVPPAKRRG